MSWTELYHYMLAVAPQFADKLVGVPEEHIVACEEGWNLRLPSAYREFLLTMGVDAGGFLPLGGFVEWNFYEVLSDLPDEYHPEDLFRIGTVTDDSVISPNDLYLDMRAIQRNGDCEVLMIEYALSPRREDASSSEGTRTFLEILTGQAWLLLDARRFAHSRVVMVSPHRPEEVVARDLAIIQLLQRAGFSSAIPSLARIDCLWLDGGRSGTARIVRRDDGLTCVVAGDSETRVLGLTEQLLDNVPDTRLRGRFPSLESLRR